MAIPNLYINRNKTYPDVYSYDVLPKGLKIQVIHIWKLFFDQEVYKPLSNYIEESVLHIDRLIAAEMQKHSIIHPNFKYNVIEGLFNFFEHSQDVEADLSLIELMNRFCEHIEKKQSDYYGEPGYNFQDIVNDINLRFKQNGIGFQYENDIIIRMDNEILHEATIKPALHFLQALEYKNANEEFLKAHEHFRHNRYEACLVECNKSFESTMKIICSKNGWVTKSEFPQAKELVNVLLTNDFLPKYHESQLSALKNLLEGSIPTIRNKYASHGKGNDNTIKPTEHLTSYTLYMTGATIKFLIEHQLEKEKQQN